MANLRVVYDNAADRATITASSTAGNLVASNLKSDYKSEVWRSTATAAQLTIIYPTAEMIGMVALAFATLSSAATFRVRGYALTSSPSPLYDVTGNACPSVEFDTLAWGLDPLGANAYSYGGATYGIKWVPLNNVQKIVLDIVDSTPLGYIEASRLITGTYWTPDYQAEQGAEVGVVDTTKNERTDAGDLRSDRGTVHKTLSFDLNFLTNNDRNKLFNILRGNGMFRPLYVSLVPESSLDVTGEQIFQIYGKLSKSGAMKYQILNQFSSTLEIEEL